MICASAFRTVSSHQYVCYGYVYGRPSAVLQSLFSRRVVFCHLLTFCLLDATHELVLAVVVVTNTFHFGLAHMDAIDYSLWRHRHSQLCNLVMSK